MPGGDRTGPAGLGPRTGRRKGYCSGFDTPGYFNAGFGQPFGAGRWGGRGRGRGRGRGIFFSYRWPSAAFGYLPVAPSPETEMENLEMMAESLHANLKSIKARIEELKSQK